MKKKAKAKALIEKWDGFYKKGSDMDFILDQIEVCFDLKEEDLLHRIKFPFTYNEKKSDEIYYAATIVIEENVDRDSFFESLLRGEEEKALRYAEASGFLAKMV